MIGSAIAVEATGCPAVDADELQNPFHRLQNGLVDVEVHPAVPSGSNTRWSRNPSVPLRVLGPHLRGVAVKDFLWEKDAKGSWKAQWKPIGEGMVRFPEFFQLLAQSDFNGPLQIHYEYPLGGADAGQRTITIPPEQVFTAMKSDLEKIRVYLAKSGLAG